MTMKEQLDVLYQSAKDSSNGKAQLTDWLLENPEMISAFLKKKNADWHGQGGGKYCMDESYEWYYVKGPEYLERMDEIAKTVLRRFPNTYY